MGYGGRVVLAVAGGYVLGRTKKMKLAIMLAGMASGNKIARDPTQLLAQSARLVQSNPQFSALSDQVRGRLVEAGKGVAVAVVSKQMESLSDRLSERTEQLGGPDERTGSARAPRRARAADVDPAADDQGDEQRADQPRPGRSTSAGDSGVGGAGGGAGGGASHRGTVSSRRKRSAAGPDGGARDA